MTEENLLLEMGDILLCILKDKSDRILSEGTGTLLLSVRKQHGQITVLQPEESPTRRLTWDQS